MRCRLITSGGTTAAPYEFDRVQSQWDANISQLLGKIAYTSDVNGVVMVLDDWKTTIGAAHARVHGFSSIKINGNWHLVVDVSVAAVTHLAVTVATRTVGTTCLNAARLVVSRLSGNPDPDMVQGLGVTFAIDKGYSASKVTLGMMNSLYVHSDVIIGLMFIGVIVAAVRIVISGVSLAMSLISSGSMPLLST